jgi:hypothetical protein
MWKLTLGYDIFTKADDFLLRPNTPPIKKGKSYVEYLSSLLMGKRAIVPGGVLVFKNRNRRLFMRGKNRPIPAKNLLGRLLYHCSSPPNFQIWTGCHCCCLPAKNAFPCAPMPPKKERPPVLGFFRTSKKPLLPFPSPEMAHKESIRVRKSRSFLF